MDMTFEILTQEEMGELDNKDLLEYKKELYEHGIEVEEYILELKCLWRRTEEVLRDRLWSLEWDVACLQSDAQEWEGSGEDPASLVH